MWVFTLLPHVRIESAFTLGRMATPTSCSASGLHPDRPMKGQGQDNGFLGTAAFPWAPRQVFQFWCCLLALLGICMSWFGLWVL